MTKYKVILQNSTVEFFTAEAAQTYKTENNGLSVETVEEEDSPPVQEARLTPMWSLRAVITLMNLRPQVEQLISTLPDSDKTVADIAWNYGNFIDINNSIVRILQQGLQLTESQVVQIFDQSDSLYN